MFLYINMVIFHAIRYRHFTIVAPQYFFVSPLDITSYWNMLSHMKCHPQTAQIIGLLMVLGKSCSVLEVWRWRLSKTIDNSLCNLFCLSDLMAAVVLYCFEVRSRTPAESNSNWKTMIVIASSSLMTSEGHVFKSLVLFALSTSPNPCCLPASCL